MNVEAIREHCIVKPNVEESFPFGDETLVFKTNSKIFLLVSLTAAPLQFNAKCDPEKSIALREEYDCIIPGFHMNKRHWNTVIIDNTLSNKKIKELIDHSYDLVSKTKKKKL